jgi:hypothetical protein
MSAGTSFQPLRSLSRRFSLCSQQVAAYGQCIDRNLNNVDTNVCQEEFQRLRACFRSNK